MSSRLQDQFGRIASDLRISVTDRCNFRCVYCVPENWNFSESERLLTFDEIESLGRIFLRMGVVSVRFTGGEPLLRPGLPELVRRFRALSPELEIALTTNGFRLAELAPELRRAGLQRVNVSLDSLKPERFRALARRDGLERVLAGVAAARAAGLSPIKINCVVVRGFNDGEVVEFAGWAREQDLIVRFIEFMPLDGNGFWQRELMVPGAWIIQKISEKYPLEPAGEQGSAPASEFKFSDGAPGGIGVISPVSAPFCARCNRLRLSAAGELRTCLFANMALDLAGPLRAGASEEELSGAIRAWVWKKARGHNIGSPDFQKPQVPMIAIGG